MDANELRSVVLPLVGEILDDVVDRVQTCLARGKHEREWWATYRAALTGLYAGNKIIHRDAADRCAAEAANNAHGPLNREGK